MLRKIYYLVICILGLLLVVVLCLNLANRYIMQQNYSKDLRLLIQMFMPPDDLFSPLVFEEINLLAEGKMYKFSYQNKYMGKHEMSFIFERPPDDFYNGDYKTKFEIQFDIVVDGRKVSSRIFRNKWSPFIGKHGSGLFLDGYQCPDDLPIEKEINIQLTVIKPDPDLVRLVGRTKLCIRKESDL